MQFIWKWCNLVDLRAAITLRQSSSAQTQTTFHLLHHLHAQLIENVKHNSMRFNVIFDAVFALIGDPMHCIHCSNISKLCIHWPLRQSVCGLHWKIWKNQGRAHWPHTRTGNRDAPSIFSPLNLSLKYSNVQMFKCSTVRKLNVRYQMSNVNQVKLLSDVPTEFLRSFLLLLSSDIFVSLDTFLQKTGMALL